MAGMSNDMTRACRKCIITWHVIAWHAYLSFVKQLSADYVLVYDHLFFVNSQRAWNRFQHFMPYLIITAGSSCPVLWISLPSCLFIHGQLSGTGVSDTLVKALVVARQNGSMNYADTLAR